MTSVIETRAPPSSLMASIEACFAKIYIPGPTWHGHPRRQQSHHRPQSQWQAPSLTKCQQVHTKADQRQHEECTDQGNRDRNSRNQSRTQILQEDIHHNKHQDKGFDQSFENLMDRSIQEVVGISCRRQSSSPEAILSSALASNILDIIDCFRCIGSCHLVIRYRLQHL